MKPLCTTDLSKLTFLTVKRTVPPALDDRMPLPHRSYVIGLEAYYLAAQLREFLALFNTPGSCVVILCSSDMPYVRVTLPNPCGANLAHWMQLTCSVFKFTPVDFRVRDGRQIFHLASEALITQDTAA